MGSAGLSMGLPGLSMAFFVILFDLPRWASNRLRKGHINRDHSSEAVAKTASVKPFCPLR
jgi:hypothetical protein